MDGADKCGAKTDDGRLCKYEDSVKDPHSEFRTRCHVCPHNPYFVCQFEPRE